MFACNSETTRVSRYSRSWRLLLILYCACTQFATSQLLIKILLSPFVRPFLP